MLVRLQVDGFKNLVNFDLRFGALTCIAGANGIGKSNVFDAIDFLRRLADNTLLDSALGVRSGDGTGDPRRLFSFDGSKYADEMRFVADMIVPAKGIDDLGQEVEATATFLRYELVLGWREGAGADPRGGLVIRKEALTHIQKGKAAESLLFPHSKSLWRDGVVMVKHRAAAFISTELEGGRRIVQLHQDGNGGRPQPFLLDALPRTVLSAATRADGPTVALARKEMRSWMQLQLEPSAMRAPSSFRGAEVMKSNGDRLAAALYRLATAREPELTFPVFAAGHAEHALAESQVCTRMANRLSGLIDDVKGVWVERDERRQLLTLMVSQGGNGGFPASSLSDGTLRFLALALIEQDPEYGGVICLEEPENGLHPSRIPSMLELLYSISVDPDEAIGEENVNRQVIFNTHSPSVVQNVVAQDLVVADRRSPAAGLKVNGLAGTWRGKLADRSVPPGLLSSYLNPVYRSGPGVDEKELVHDQQQLKLSFDSAA